MRAGSRSSVSSSACTTAARPRPARPSNPAHLVAFDLLRVHGADLTGRLFGERYTALVALFLEEGLATPWTLCPTTTNPEQAAGWLADYTAGRDRGSGVPAVGGPVCGGPRGAKYKARHTVEAIVGAVTGSLRAPTTALVGRYDEGGRLRYTGPEGFLWPAHLDRWLY
jgi:hypothetical protein